MIKSRPYHSHDDLRQRTIAHWQTMHKDDLLEAFAGHPKIGDLSSLKEKFHGTSTHASQEQSGVESASEAVLEQLAEFNNAYENKFGFIFIVCASGKSAQEMLNIIKVRILHDYGKELTIAAEEQLKITLIRLERLVEA